MRLDLSSLEKAVHSMERALAVAAECSTMPNAGRALTETIRAGVIQNFEFTYELCWKFMGRWLKEIKPQEAQDAALSRKDLFRLAAKHGLIPDPLPWFEYGDARNLSAHTYEESKAEIIYQTAVKFLPEAVQLLQKLEKEHA